MKIMSQEQLKSKGFRKWVLGPLHKENINNFRQILGSARNMMVKSLFLMNKRGRVVGGWGRRGGKPHMGFREH